jgi:ATP-binding cassette subfamily B protein
LQPKLGLRLDLASGVLEEAVSVAAATIAPFLLKHLIDDLSRGTPAAIPLALEIAAFVLAWSSTSPIAALKLIHTSRLVETLSARLIGDALGAQLPLIAKQRAGDTGQALGALERLPFSLQVLIDTIIWRGASLALQTTISLLALALAIPGRYAAVLAITLAFYLLASDLGAKRVNGEAGQANLAAAELSTALGEVLRNARRIVFNGAVDDELGQISARTAQRGDAASRLAWRLVLMTMLQYLAVGAGLTCLLMMSAIDVRAGKLTVGDFALLQAYAFRLTVPLGGFAISLRQAGLALANIKACLAMAEPAASRQTRPEPAASAAPRWAEADIPAAVKLEQLSFRYEDGAAAIDKVSLDIPAGAFVAIVGANGCGKSTLAQLLAGLIEPTAGRVLLNGQDVSLVAPYARHRLALYVPQFISLFNRSIGTNGLYPPTEQTAEQLARLLDAWRFYADRSGVDLDTRVGEQGERLSGGQIQKLELARLHGVKVPVLLLDESTSALDAASTRQIMTSLHQTTCSTLIVVSHDPNVVQLADLVIYLQNGRLIATAPHHRLMQIHADYRDFWDAA